MSGTRRMSLRARMLVMLIGVTTFLLLIMGTVSTVVLIHRVDKQVGQFEAALRLESMLTPQALEANSAGYAVVEVPVELRLTAVALTSGNVPQLTNQVVRAINKRLSAPGFRAIQKAAAQGNRSRVEQMLVAGDGEPLVYLGSKEFDVAPGIRAAGQWIPPGRVGGPAMLFVAKPTPNEPAQVRGFIIAELITGAALIALLALAGEWLIGQGLEPLDEMTRTAKAITSRGDLTARMPDADDQTEVGKLGASINTMLDWIQQAFSSRLHSEQKVREFAADASHELRTPLTTIRGYAELYRQGALGPDQLPNAMRRIEQEAQRMSTLVAELLELARLDRTSSLDLTETDLASVVRDAVADAIAVEPQRPVRAEAPPRLVAVVDEPRVRQVLANLLGNVRAHTPVTTPVAVRLGEITGGVLIEVVDAGPGMSREDAIRAFDRFHRAVDRPGHRDAADSDGGSAESGEQAEYRPAGEYRVAGAQSEVAASLAWRAARSGSGGSESSGDSGSSGSSGAAQNGAASRNGGSSYNGGQNSKGNAQGAAERSGGSGLGLSIVQAIAHAHGGRATLESWPGRGTKVRVWLPVRIVP
jgi:signal transduction histidine kinase